MLEKITSNPAAITGLVRAVLAVGIILGLPLTEEQTAAAVAIVSILLSVFTVKATVPKSQVTETADSVAGTTPRSFLRNP